MSRTNWRRGQDLNLRKDYSFNALAKRRLKPLSHLSKMVDVAGVEPASLNCQQYKSTSLVNFF